MKIDKNIPVPAKAKYPFEELQKGDSFVFGKYSADLQRNAFNLKYYYEKKHKGREFSCREDADGFLRVWRTK